MYTPEKDGLFLKSLPEHGMGLNGQDDKGKLIIKQSLADILATQTLIPNTTSFGMNERICYTHIPSSMYYTIDAPYRPAGIIFSHRDGDRQDYFVPSDMLALTASNTIPSNKQQVMDNIKKYYNKKLIAYRKLFATEDIQRTLERMHHYGMIAMKGELDEKILGYINMFRKDLGYKPLTAEHKRLWSYNECIKFAPLKIQPHALFGKNENIRHIAEQHNIPHYNTFAEYKHHKDNPDIGKQ